MRWGSLLAIVVAQTTLAAPLPFSDGFEPPETNFSSWTLRRVNGANQLTQSTQQAWQGTQSLKFTFAGNTTLEDAAAVLDFDSATPTAHVRLWLYVPAGTEVAMATGTHMRLVLLMDSTTADGGSLSPPKVRLNIFRASASPNRIYLQLAYENASSNSTLEGSQSLTALTEGVWHFVELRYEPMAPRLRLYLDDALLPKIDLAPTDMVARPLRTCWVGLANSADGQSSPISLFVDNVTIGSGLLPPPLDGGVPVDAGSPADAGPPDAGALDAGAVDAGLADAGAADAGLPDAGLADAGSADAGLADGGWVDGGAADAGAADAGFADAGFADAGPADAGLTDAGLTDAGFADAGSTDAGAATDGGSGTDGGFGDGGTDAGFTGEHEAIADLGCGCSSGPLPGAALWLLALGLRVRRTRRALPRA